MDLLSRKFLIAVGVLVIMAVALFMRISTVEQFIMFSEWIVGIFCTANVVEAGVGMITEK